MIEIKGNHVSAKVFTDSLEVEAYKQIEDILNSPLSEGELIRIMPDVHVGKSGPIGFTMTFRNGRVAPSIVGVDIGCGVSSYKLSEKLDLEAVDLYVRENIPMGHKVYDTPLISVTEESIFCADVGRVCKRTGQDYNYVMRSLGTLGGGNHFIEIGEDGMGGQWLSVHTGSRNFGLKVATYHQEVAIKQMPRYSVEKIKKDYEDELKVLGLDFDGEELGRRILNKPKVQRGLEYLEGKYLVDYFHDMAVAQEFADMSRNLIVNKIMHHFGVHAEQRVESVHNYIDFGAGIVRKGAISAKAGEAVTIPLNMRDGMVIGYGLGNEDWNNSAPHGAGRKMSRSHARATLSLEEFEKQMEGIVSSSVCQSTLDEAPGAYKDTDEILGHLKDTVVVKYRVIPVWNIKAI